MTEGRGQRFLLERYLGAELGEEERESLESRLQVDAALREELEALRRDQQAFLEELPYAAFRIEHERRVAEKARPQGWAAALRWLSAAGALGATAALALWVTPISPADAPTERIKGAGVGLNFAVLEDDRLRTGTVGELLSGGTIVQLTYDAGPYRYLALVGIDGTGRVETYYPEVGHQSGELPEGAKGRFPFSLTLDESPGVEKFFAVFSSEPLSLDAVRGAAQAVAKEAHEVTHLPLTGEVGANVVGQASVWVRKP